MEQESRIKYQKPPEKIDIDISYYRNLRRRVIALLGNRCDRCGFSDWRALQIDHINGKGYKFKKRKYKGYSQGVLFIDIKKYGRIKYQLLCANCNWIKRYENNEVRKSKGAHIDLASRELSKDISKMNENAMIEELSQSLAYDGNDYDD